MQTGIYTLSSTVLLQLTDSFSLHCGPARFWG